MDDELPLAELYDRLERLEDAHRALSAQHVALLTTMQCLLPIMPIDPAAARRAALMAYDICNDKMEEAGQDAEHQAAVRVWLDRLAKSLLASEGMPPRHPKPT